MSKISNQSVYPAVTPVDGDYIIGTDVSDSNSTKTFLYSGIFSYINDKLTDPSITPVYASKKVVQEVRFSEAVSKGDPVYISGYNAGQNRPEVLKADASDSSQMPSFGLAAADYDINTNGYIISAGDLTDVDTDVLGNEGDTVYVAPGGGLTITKPTGSNLIQNVGKISRSNQSNGSIEVFSVGRTNDVPNLSTGKIWVGSAANTIESTVVHLDETNNRLGIGTNSPSQKLDVVGSIEVSDGIYIGGTAVANKLDDYEEGTFTPTLVTTGTETNPITKQGRYTKIGNLVTVTIMISVTVGEFTTLSISECSNLPFTIRNESSFAGIRLRGVAEYDNATTDAFEVYCEGLEGTLRLFFRKGNSSIALESDSDNKVMAQITYEVE